VGADMTLDEVLPLLDSPAGDPYGRKPIAPDRHVWFFCPCHVDGSKYGKRSATFHPRYGLTCFAGCDRRDILAELKKCNNVHPLHSVNSHPDHRSRSKSVPGRIVACYPYPDESGRLLYQALRKEMAQGKTFLVRRPDGKSGWIWELGDTRRVLYRLPELLAADPADFVFIVEGEKCADALAALGLVATTSVFGARAKWEPEYAECLRRRRVCILPDNDPPGAAHADDVARSLVGVAAEVRIIILPGLPFKGDVVDWLDMGGSREKLLALAERSNSPQQVGEVLSAVGIA